jgi:DNA repair exonuclease SbcCD nuclease subunit
MKIAIVTDLHFGVRCNTKIGETIKNAQRSFYSNLFFPYLKKHNISHINILGDVFDHRKGPDTSTLTFANDVLFSNLKPFKTNIIVGNHDTVFKNTINPNSLSILTNLHNVNLIDTPSTVDNIDLIPWICEYNEGEITSFIKNSNSHFAMGHFDLKGFMMNKGVESLYDSRDKDFLYQYTKVLSGHFHTRSTSANIEYVGAPYEMNWNDYDDPRGFSIFDSNTGNVEYINNENTLFDIIEYDDGLNEWPKSNNIIRLIVKNRNNTEMYEKVIHELNNMSVDLKIIIEDELDIENIIYDETKKQLNTQEYLIGWVDRLEINNKDYVKDKLNLLFERTENGLL